jgi:hypothetical protein
MKKLLFLLSTLLMLFLYTCTKDEGLVPDSSGTADLKSAHSHGTVITVSPNGSDDTQTLINAFEEAKAAGPGSVVNLTEGTFRIGFVEIRDFYGHFKGAGKEKTRIQNLDDMPSCLYFYENNMFTMLLNFVGGNVHVSQMTFATTDGPVTPDDLYYGFLPVLLGISDYTAMYTPANRYIKATVEDVDFVGGNYGGTNSVFGTDHNVAMPLFAGAQEGTVTLYSHIDITIKHCGFYHAGNGPDVFGLDDNSNLVIEDNISKNTFYGLFIGGYLGLKANIKNNRFYESPMGNILDNSGYGLMPDIKMKQRPEFYISGNYFQGLAGMTTLTMIDTRHVQYPDEGLPHLFEVRGNFFEANDDANTILILNTVGSKIWNNKFIGNATIGVYIDGDSPTGIFAENLQLTGNNFFGGTYSDATVYLGPFSMNCKVVGVPSDQVVDLGQNNSIIGTKAHKSGVHPIHPMQHNFRSMHR